MLARKRRLSLAFATLTVAAAALTASAAWALGLGLGETKEQLKLKYDVSATDHRTGRVTVNVTIADQGRLKPLSSVELRIPSQEGTGYVDLSIPIATREVDGKLTASVHLRKEWAEQGSIQLNTNHLDGKQLALTWWYHSIPIAKYLKGGEQKKD